MVLILVKKKTLEEKGYNFINIDRKSFEREFGIESAPLLIVLDKTKKMRYLGGYFLTSGAKLPRDKEIFDQIRRNDNSLKPLPVYGCAVSDALRNYIDPLGINEL